MFSKEHITVKRKGKRGCLQRLVARIYCAPGRDSQIRPDTPVNKLIVCMINVALKLMQFQNQITLASVSGLERANRTEKKGKNPISFQCDEITSWMFVFGLFVQSVSFGQERLCDVVTSRVVQPRCARCQIGT